MYGYRKRVHGWRFIVVTAATITTTTIVVEHGSGLGTTASGAAVSATGAGAVAVAELVLHMVFKWLDIDGNKYNNDNNIIWNVSLQLFLSLWAAYFM